MSPRLLRTTPGVTKALPSNPWFHKGQGEERGAEATINIRHVAQERCGCTRAKNDASKRELRQQGCQQDHKVEAGCSKVNHAITQKRPPGADTPSLSLSSGIQLYVFAFWALARAFTLPLGLSAWTPVLSAAGRPLSYVFCLRRGKLRVSSILA